jgi:cytidylate kinase
MAVITISRELGSEGTYIARQLAQTLNYHYVDKSHMADVLKQYGMVNFPEEYETIKGYWGRADPNVGRMVEMLNRAIQAIAYHGNTVILGRGSFAVLGRFTDVLNVRIQAPLHVRIKRVMQEQNIAEQDKAEAIVEENDALRTYFILSWYRVRWDTASAFNLVIDTGKVPRDMAVTWLVGATNALVEKQENGRPTTRTLQVDSILADTVSQVLNCQVVH